jgi:uncharacterized repeat protein (TIGR02543 family)
MAVAVYTAVLIALGAALLTGGSNGAAPTAHLTVERTGAGTVHGALSCPPHAGPCSATVTKGTTLTLTADAASGSRFRGWSGACTGRDVCRVTLDADRTVTATFVKRRPPARVHPPPVILSPPPPVALHIDHQGAGHGTVAVLGGARCSGDCTIAITRGEVLTLTAEARAGYRFDGWTAPQACRASTTCDVQVRAEMTVAARFSAVSPPRKRFTLTLATAGPGSVDLCHGTRACARTYDAGTQVALTARPHAHGAFQRWDGCTAYGATCRVAMTRDRTVTVHFLRTVVLTTSLAGDARIDVRGRGACGHGCTFRRGARAELRVTHGARAGVKWTGVRCDGDTCTVPMTRDRTVTAAISAPPRVTQTWHAVQPSGGAALNATPAHTLDVRTSPGGSVQIGAVRCRGVTPCRHQYAHGTVLALVAVPDPGAEFVRWGGCPDATDTTCEVVFTSDRAVIAIFTPPPGA